MRLELLVITLISTSVMIQRVEGLSVPNTKELSSCNISRRNYLGFLTTAAAFATTILPSKALAFDGSGSSAYAGRSPATKAELKRGYQERVAADARDFNSLGKAIRNGETEGSAWVNFFIQFQRREPDSIGRTYAALVDLRGIRIKKEEFEGGDGMLLANTFTKAGKPPGKKGSE